MTGASDMIDWDLAVRLGSRIATDGPKVTREEAEAAVEELRDDAARSTQLVRDFTGLEAPDGTAPVLVIDRKGWVQANADGFKTVLAPLVDKLTEKRPPSGAAKVIGRKITGAEVGGLLGFLCTKVLGQFDPFFSPAGRLLLVAPNIVHIERELGVDPTDFRLWVCLHEETHRVQFTANPWLRDHLFDQVGQLAGLTDAGSLLDDLVGRIAQVVRGDGPTGSLIDLVSTPEQREIFDRLTAVMSLLEGHADVVMDGVGPKVIPSVEHIRSKFTERRKGVGTLDRILRRLLGLDAKMAQYRDGATFVRHVVDALGMERFNTIWTGPDTLPTLAEIHDPEAWIQRVPGL
ncbi:zinc-dependent metalloprotease [Nocardioides sp. Kera G14]|uniref:zinc-dependent metalloprotease n=1 Tax=Nocardioides sp. Kera G14 TaxID=2884264 RepID=UPI001D0FBD75|nr:zinc-dependent metalloprotease [Nocardioides sp. Kera G14]UDY23839.1 zinc-dependent metalloprotease [Nocardioides sp. Kera G14]